MKTIFKSILALGAAALMAVSCNVENVGALYDNTDNSAGVSFLLNAVSQTEIPAAQTSYTVTVSRRTKSGSVTANLSSTLPAAIKVPSSVTFADGQATADVQIDLSAMEVGTAYKGDIKIESETDDIARKSISCTFQKAYTFNKFGTGTYHFNSDDCYFSGTQEGLEIYKADGFDVFQIPKWCQGGTLSFYVNADGYLITDDCFTGFTHSSYGKMNVKDCSTYFSTWDPAKDGMGKYDAATKTFTFSLTYYVSAGYFGYGFETFKMD